MRTFEAEAHARLHHLSDNLKRGSNVPELARPPQGPVHSACRAYDRRELLTSISPRGLAEYATEQLGLEVQALSLARSRSRNADRLQVWELMTPYGLFWLVEDGVVAELFPIASLKTSRQTTAASGMSRAMRRFRELHQTCHASRRRTTSVND